MKVIREILRLALPAIGEMSLYMLVWFFDTMMVGKYSGQIGVSSVGLSSEIIYSFYHILISVGIAISMTSMIARALGSGDEKKAENVANMGIKVAIIIAIFFFLTLFIFSSNILKIARAEGEILTSGSSYMKIVAFGMLFSCITNTINGIFRGYKNTKTPFKVALIANIVNIFLDYALIFGKFGLPELGVKGAAIATSISLIASFSYAVYSIRSLIKINLFSKIKVSELKELFSFAIPSSLQEFAFSSAKLLTTVFVIKLGAASFASNQITIAIESVSFMPAWGISMALTSLVGYSFGKKNYKEFKDYVSYSTLITLGVVFIISTVFLTVPDFIIKLFIKHDELEVISTGILCLKIAAIEQLPLALAMLLQGALKGIGDTKTPFKVALFTNWFIRVPFCFYYLVILQKSVVYFWIITTIQWTFEAIILLYFYLRKTAKYK